MENICRIVDETPFISDLQKTFYKEILRIRKTRIIDFSLQLLNTKEQVTPSVEPEASLDQKISFAKDRNSWNTNGSASRNSNRER